MAPPPVSALGQPLTIQGAFDGDMRNTRVTLDGQPAAVIAESPRMMAIRSPSTGAGAKIIEVRDQGVSVTGKTNLVQVSLSASKLKLRSGESTELITKVAGLRGLAKTAFPVPLTLRNESPGTIQMKGGNTQTHAMGERGVDSGGTFTLKSRATASRTGSFTVMARIAAPANVFAFPGGWSSGWWGDDRDRPIDMDGIDRIGQLDRYSVRRLMDTLRDLRARKRWDYVGSREHQAWLAAKIKLVKAALRQKGVEVADLPIDAADY
jgi:hypothetical protein